MSPSELIILKNLVLSFLDVKDLWRLELLILEVLLELQEAEVDLWRCQRTPIWISDNLKTRLIVLFTKPKGFLFVYLFLGQEILAPPWHLV